MTATSDTRTSGVAVLDRLGVVEDPLVGADPVSFLRSLASAAGGSGPEPGRSRRRQRPAGARARCRSSRHSRAGDRSRLGWSGVSGEGRQALQGPGLRREPPVLPARAAVPAARQAGHRAARRGRAGTRQGCQGAVCREVHARCAFAHQHPARQPCGAAAGVRHRRQEPGPGSEEHARRHPAQRRMALAGRQQRLRGRSQHGSHPRPGGLPQRPDRADPVRAPGQAGALGAAAVLPAVDQQVLHHGPRSREEPDRVGRPARSHLLRHQLPQPRRVDARPGLRGLPQAGARWTRSGSSRRSPGPRRSTPCRSASVAR